MNQTEVKIVETYYKNGMIGRRVIINDELFYEECHSRNSLRRKSNSKLEAFCDWVAGNEKTKTIKSRPVEKILLKIIGRGGLELIVQHNGNHS